MKVSRGGCRMARYHYRPLYWLLGTSVRERESLGIHRPLLSGGPMELSHQWRREIVLIHKRKHGGLGSKPSGKACTGRLRGLPQTSSAMSYELDGPGPPAGCSHTRRPVSGCPAVVMVESTHDRKSDHLLACVTRGHGWSA